MMIEIKHLRSADGGRAVTAECTVTHDDGKPVTETYLLLPEQYRDLGIHRGAITEEVYGEIKAASEVCRAIRRGRYLLSFGSNSERTLTQKLRSKGFSAQSAAQAAGMLAENGEIREKSDAVRDAERYVEKGEGRRRIELRLSEKGYGDEAVSAAGEYLDGVDFAQVCRRVIEKKWGGALPSDPDEKRRAAASLARLGFTFTDIKNGQSR